MEDINIEKLINSIQNKQIIWNINHPLYKNIKRKAEAWKSVSKECGIEIEGAKRKWKGLRDSYARELNKRATAMQNGEALGSKWKYLEVMHFLKEQLITRKPDSNYAENTFSTGFSPIECVVDVSPNFVDNITYYSPSTSEREAPAIKESPIYFDESAASSSEYTRSTKRCRSDLEASLLNTMHSFNNFLAPFRETTFNNEDELFCRCLMAKISKFPLPQKNRAKMKMMQFLCEIEEELENSK